MSLVMQAASSEPIDEMVQEETTNQLSASLPDQLLESFIARFVMSQVALEYNFSLTCVSRAHAMTETQDEALTGRKRKSADEDDHGDGDDLDILQDYLKKKKDKRKDYGLDNLRRVREVSSTKNGSVRHEPSRNDDDILTPSSVSKEQPVARSYSSDQVMAVTPSTKRRYAEKSTHGWYLFYLIFTFSSRPGRPPKPKFLVPIEIEPYGPRGRR